MKKLKIAKLKHYLSEGSALGGKIATWKLKIALAALVLVVVALVAGVFLFPKARAVGITKYAINAGGNWSAK